MIPMQLVDDALERLKRRYNFLDFSHIGFRQVSENLGKVVYVHSLEDLTVSHNIYYEDGRCIIKGISVVIVKPVSTKGKMLSDYL
jgi:hypothetical protein